MGSDTVAFIRHRALSAMVACPARPRTAPATSRPSCPAPRPPSSGTGLRRRPVLGLFTSRRRGRRRRGSPLDGTDNGHDSASRPAPSWPPPSGRIVPYGGSRIGVLTRERGLRQRLPARSAAFIVGAKLKLPLGLRLRASTNGFTSPTTPCPHGQALLRRPRTGLLGAPPGPERHEPCESRMLNFGRRGLLQLHDDADDGQDRVLRSWPVWKDHEPPAHPSQDGRPVPGRDGEPRDRDGSHPLLRPAAPGSGRRSAA